MKSMLALAMIALMAPAAHTAPEVDGLPALHKIQSATLSPTYSCRSTEEFHKGYQATVLFVSRYSRERNSPDLLFDGACKSADYFSGATAGDDMSLIADLGSMRLEDVSAHLAFNPQDVAGHESSFASSVPVAQGHTYALLINKSAVRGLVVFQVDDYQPNKSVKLRYAVKEYQLMVVAKPAEGFNWTVKNAE